MMKNGYSKSKAKTVTSAESIKHLHIKISNGYVHVYSYTENSYTGCRIFFYITLFKIKLSTLRSAVQNTRVGTWLLTKIATPVLKLIAILDHK